MPVTRHRNGAESLFTDPAAPRPRIIISSEGETKTGRSSFGFWGPDPVLHVNVDRRVERVIDKFIDGTVSGTPKVIKQLDMCMPQPVTGFFTKSQELRDRDEHDRAAAEKLWNKFVTGYKQALTEFRTIVIDTLTELYDIRLLAEFGRLMGFRQRERGGANGDIVEIIRMAEDYDTNLVIIHQVKDEYVKISKRNAKGEMEDDSAATGKRIIKGYKSLPYITQAHLRHSYDEKTRKFVIEVDRCGTNAELNKVKFTEDDWHIRDESGATIVNYGPFAWIASLMTDTPVEEWL